ncbi:MAG: DUF2304 family protein [Patescibacteria group bacterium]
MIQQIIAVLLILLFFSKILAQWKKKTITNNEFAFWSIFWGLGIIIIIMIKPIDRLVLEMGFSSSGISLVFYMSVMILFYLIFKMRLRILKLEKNITDIARKITLKD